MPRYKWGKHHYVPAVLRQKSPKDLEREFKRLRRILRQRVAALSRSEFNTTKIYYDMRDLLEISDIIPPGTYRRDLPYLVTDIYEKLESKLGSVRKQQKVRKKALKTLHEHGYKFVNRKNWQQFGQFMEEARERLLNSYYDSDAVADMFNDAQREKLSPKELQQRFEEYVESEKKRMDYERRKFY